MPMSAPIRRSCVAAAATLLGHLAIPAPLLFAQEAVPTAHSTLFGPIATAHAGDASRNYVFFATNFDLSHHGYVEEEFFLEGQAARYTIVPDHLATVRDTGHHYKTRIVVRRPKDPARFNGTVLVEWLNVTAGFDIDIDWQQAHEYLIRAGYGWVGVSAQRIGVHGPQGLRAWSRRYETLDLTDAGTILDDALRFDVFSQAAHAVRHPGAVRALGPLQARLIVATGHSQSANQLAIYYNGIQPVTGAFDGFMIHGGGGPLRADSTVKAWKLLSETDLELMHQAASRQPDSDTIRTWEVAGASHLDSYYLMLVQQLQQRDFGAALTLDCNQSPGSRVPFRYVMYAAYERLVRWIRGETAPPMAPPITLSSEGPPVIVARDSFGNAMGGIRLPTLAVPTATNTGVNSGGPFCAFAGSYEPFPPTTLSKLYRTHAAYVRAVRNAASATVREGYLLPVDADGIVREAQASAIGIASGRK